MTRATLLRKADCALCEQAKAVLDQLAAEYPLEVEVLSVDTAVGAELAAVAGMAFPPAVLLDGDPYSYGRLSERKLRRELDRRARASTRSNTQAMTSPDGDQSV